MQSRRCADKAHEDWCMRGQGRGDGEAAVKLGYGGSLLKDMKLLRCRQMLKPNSMLLTQNGTQLYSVADKQVSAHMQTSLWKEVSWWSEEEVE